MRVVTNAVTLQRRIEPSAPRFTSAVALLALCATPAFAQDNAGDRAAVEEIVVTAQKRSENVQDVPLSISAFSGETIRERGFEDLTELARFVPGFSIDPANASRNSSVNIRGIGSSGANPGIESSVGVFIDGVYQPSAGQLTGELLDIASVEVLRGPQGTLYGRNTPVGALNITTKAPGFETDAQIRVGYGNYDLYHAAGYLTGPLNATVAARGSFWVRDRSGYEKNLFDGERINDYSGFGGRSRLLVDASEAVRINLIGHYEKITQNCCIADQLDVNGPIGIATPGFLAAQTAIGLPFRNFNATDHVVDADESGRDQSEAFGVSSQVDWTWGSGHTLVSITAFDRWENSVSTALDALPQDVQTSDQRQINRTFSQEFRLVSPAGKPLDYILGAFVYFQDTDFDQVNVINAGANRIFPTTTCGVPAVCRYTPGDSGGTDYQQETFSYAAFANATYQLTEAWRVTLGARYSRDEKSVFIDHFNSPTASRAFNATMPPLFVGSRQRNESALTGSFNTRFQITDRIMVFATVSNGFKAGGFNARRVQPGSAIEFDSERSLTYEAGIKSTLFDRRLVLNATVFNLRLRDFQENVPNPTGAGFIVGNAGERVSRGVELDFRAQPVDWLGFDGAVAYLDAEYTDRSNGACPTGQTPNGTTPNTCNFNGVTPPNSPRWRVASGFTVNRTVASGIDLTLRGDLSYTSSRNNLTSIFPSVSEQRAFTLYNLRASLASADDRWLFSLWGKNLSDEAYYNVTTPNPSNGSISGGGTAPARGFLGYYAPPRTFGAEVTVRF